MVRSYCDVENVLFSFLFVDVAYHYQCFRFIADFLLKVLLKISLAGGDNWNVDDLCYISLLLLMVLLVLAWML